MRVLLLPGFFLVGCSVASPSGGDSGADTSESADTSGDTAADTSVDTGGSADPTACGYPDSIGDPGGPVFHDAVGSWEDYPSFGVVLQVTATVADEGGDLDGGTCFIDAFHGAEEVVSTGGSVGSSATVTCYLRDDSLLFALEDLDDHQATDVVFLAEDASGNDSAQCRVSVAGQ